MSYNSKYTGKQVEEILDKANSSTNVTESTVANWGFTKNTGTYSKPSGGIPKSDLASAVQTLLNKADTALQSYTEQYKGTVTSVKINGATKTPNANGMVDLGTIEGGGGSSSGGSGAYAEVSHGTGDTTFTLTPNTFHVWDEVDSLDLSFADEQSGVANEYLFQFTSGATATTLTLPDVKWANDSAPTIAENMIYQISVLKGLASVLEFSNVVVKVQNLISGTSYGNIITSQYPVASDITIQYWDAFGEDIYNATITKGSSEVAITEKFGYVENVSPFEDDKYYYVF